MSATMSSIVQYTIFILPSLTASWIKGYFTSMCLDLDYSLDFYNGNGTLIITIYIMVQV